jgi:hypothetical protein
VAVFRVAFVYGCLLLFVLVVLVLELRLVLALLAARLLLFLLLGGQLDIPVRRVSARFLGVAVLPKGDPLGPLMRVGELQVQVVDLFEESLALAVILGAVIGEEGISGADLLELFLLQKVLSEVVEEGLVLL